MYDYIGFENGTGLLQKDRPDGFINPQDKSRSLSVDNVDKFVSDVEARSLGHEEHVKQLMEQMDLAILYKGKLCDNVTSKLFRFRWFYVSTNFFFTVFWRERYLYHRELLCMAIN